MNKHLWPIKIDDAAKKELDTLNTRVSNDAAKRLNDLALLRQSKKTGVTIDEVIAIQSRLN